MRASKVDRSKKESQHPAAFAKGGHTPMAKPQAAGPARSGTTGKNPTKAPGARSASGGNTKLSSRSSQFAKRGVTGPR